MKYIGKRVLQQNSTDKTYLGSGVRLLNAIRKYGRENFIREILCECYSKEDLNEMEVYYISYYGANKSNLFYNLSEGGEGGDLTNYKKFRKICQYDLQGKLLNIFKNGGEVQRALNNYSHKSVLRCCWGEKNKYKEYIFKFYEDTFGNDIDPYITTKGKHCEVKIIQLTTNGMEIGRFDSIAKAERILGINNIYSCIVGKQKTAGGFKWKYAA